MTELDFKNCGLSEDLLKALEKLDYNNPTEVQRRVIPIALNGVDIIVRSQTGSGKTAAFAIPICEKIDIEAKEPQVLILAPTRELAVQIKEDVTNIGRFKRIRCAAVFGKQPVSIQLRELRQRVHMVVGTPGRTLDLIKRGEIVVEKIKYVVIDEADKLLNMGFIEEVGNIIKALPEKRVTMLFSATIPEEIEDLCKRFMKNPERIDIASKAITADKIKQELYRVDEREKFRVLNKIIYVENPESCIIFCRTKENVDTLAEKMKEKGYSCNSLHGGMLQQDRLNIMKDFKRGEFKFLIATDVAARGIDIEDLTHIINYDVPVEKDSYVHRIGRTGRAGSSGKAITLMSAGEYGMLKEIEEYIGYRIPEGRLPSEAEIDNAKKIFISSQETTPKLKSDKGEKLSREITKIYINAGKKKKIRPGDIVGAITNIDGITSENVGIIDIQDNFSYIDILDGKGKEVLKGLEKTTVKGKTIKAEMAQK